MHSICSCVCVPDYASTIDSIHMGHDIHKTARSIFVFRYLTRHTAMNGFLCSFLALSLLHFFTLLLPSQWWFRRWRKKKTEIEFLKSKANSTRKNRRKMCRRFREDLSTERHAANFPTCPSEFGVRFTIAYEMHYLTPP